MKEPSRNNVVLIAHIPFLTGLHLEWFKSYSNCPLFIITEEMVGELLPSYYQNSQNKLALPTYMMKTMMIHSLGFVLDFPTNVSIFLPWVNFSKKVVLPEQEISHLFADKYLKPLNIGYLFEEIGLTKNLVLT